MSNPSKQIAPCLCGRGHRTKNSSGWHSDCQAECKCGCGQRARYSYAPGHHPKQLECFRCGKVFTPHGTEGGLCSQCRRHVRDGAPLEQNGQLIHARKMQAAAPEGRKWCSGCHQYRLIRFFGILKSKTQETGETKYYSRCKPCLKKHMYDKNIIKRYKLDRDAYERLKTFQGGKCAICQRATGASRHLSVDHDHSCCSDVNSCGNCVRGLICGHCNRMLGFARDDPEMFKRAAQYLREPPAQAFFMTED